MIDFREIQQLPPFENPVTPGSGTVPSGPQYGMETAIPGQNPTGAARKLTLGMIYGMFKSAVDEGFNAALLQSVSYSETDQTITVTLRSGDTYPSNPIPVAGASNPNPGLITNADWNKIQQLVSDLQNLEQNVTVLEGGGQAYYVTENQWNGGFTGSESPSNLQILFTTISGTANPKENDIMVHVSSGTSWVFLNDSWNYITYHSWEPAGNTSQLLRGDGTPTGALIQDLNQGNSGNIILGTQGTFKGLCAMSGIVGISTYNDGNGIGASGAAGISASSAGMGMSSPQMSGGFGMSLLGINICYSNNNGVGSNIRINNNAQQNIIGGGLIELDGPGSTEGLTITKGDATGEYVSLRLYDHSNLHVVNKGNVTIRNTIFNMNIANFYLSKSSICICSFSKDELGGLDLDGTPTAKNLYGSSYPQSIGNGAWPPPFQNIPFPNDWYPTNYGSMTADYTADKLKAVLRIPVYHGCFPRTCHLAASRPDINSPFTSDSGWL